jgi:AraC-like DNA-binding protein
MGHAKNIPVNIPTNDLASFNHSFARRELMTPEDVDAYLNPVPAANYFRMYRTETSLRVLGAELPPNRFNFYFINFVRTGEADKTIGLTKFRLRSNTLWFVPPAQVHSSQNWTPDTTGFYAGFSADFVMSNALNKSLLADAPFYQLDGVPYLYLEQAEADGLYEIFTKIYSEQESAAEYSNDIIRLYLQEILYKARRIYNAQQQQVPEHERKPLELVNRFKKLIEEHFRSHQPMSFYAGQFSLHPHYFTTLISSVAGVPPGDLIRERLLLEAKSLLAHTNLSSKELAFYLGFEDASYFSRFFKKYTGCSPLEYRTMLVSL